MPSVCTEISFPTSPYKLIRQSFYKIFPSTKSLAIKLRLAPVSIKNFRGRSHKFVLTIKYGAPFSFIISCLSELQNLIPHWRFLSISNVFKVFSFVRKFMFKIYVQKCPVVPSYLVFRIWTCCS